MCLDAHTNRGGSCLKSTRNCWQTRCCRRDVARFRVEKAIDRCKLSRTKANLEAALEYFDKENLDFPPPEESRNRRRRKVSDYKRLGRRLRPFAVWRQTVSSGCQSGRRERQVGRVLGLPRHGASAEQELGGGWINIPDNP
jgi:hypothetical protein